MKKGVLFTIVFSMMALLVLVMAILMFQSLQKSKVRVAELAGMDKLYNIYSSVEQGLVEIFNLYSGIKINMSMTDYTLTIEEGIPSKWSNFSEKFESFGIEANKFKDFVESNFPEINLNLESSGYIPLLIKPYNISYNHTEQGGFPIIQIIPSEINFAYYDIYVYSGINENVTSIIVEEPPTEGVILFNVTADDYGWGRYPWGNHETYKEYVDLTKTVNVKIFFESGRELRIKVPPKENGKLEILNQADNEIIIRTTIGFDEPLIDVTYSDDVIDVNFPELGISKTGTIEII